MGLNKYGKDKWEDISDWTPEMIKAKINELENEKEQAYKEYARHCEKIDKQIRYLKNGGKILTEREKMEKLWRSLN